MECDIATFGFSIIFSREVAKYILGAFAKLRKATISFVMPARLSLSLSVCLSAWNNSDPTGRILMKSYIIAFCRKSVEKMSVINIQQK